MAGLMSYIYQTLRSMFLFYFIAVLFQDVIIFGDNQFSDYIVPAFLFGVLIALLPHILVFLKLGTNTASIILGMTVLIFIYYVAGYYFFDLFSIAGSGKIDFGYEVLTIETEDQTIGLILLSIISAGLNVIMQLLNVTNK